VGSHCHGRAPRTDCGKLAATRDERFDSAEIKRRVTNTSQLGRHNLAAISRSDGFCDANRPGEGRVDRNDNVGRGSGNPGVQAGVLVFRCSASTGTILRKVRGSEREKPPLEGATTAGLVCLERPC
jgi:hypothetical protein